MWIDKFSLATQPFLNNLVHKMGGESLGRLPEGATLRVMKFRGENTREEYEILPQTMDEDQLEVEEVEDLLRETTPSPADDHIGGYDSPLISNSLDRKVLDTDPSVEP